MVLELKRKVSVEIHIWELLAIYKLFHTSYMKAIIVSFRFFSFKCQADLVLFYLASLLNTELLWLLLNLLVSYLSHPISGSLCRFLYNYIVKAEHSNKKKQILTICVPWANHLGSLGISFPSVKEENQLFSLKKENYDSVI